MISLTSKLVEGKERMKKIRLISRKLERKRKEEKIQDESKTINKMVEIILIFLTINVCIILSSQETETFRQLLKNSSDKQIMRHS